jgi:hypothetical protein
MTRPAGFVAWRVGPFTLFMATELIFALARKVLAS